MLPNSVCARQCAKKVRRVFGLQKTSWSSRSWLHVVGRHWLCDCHNGQHGDGQQGFSACTRCGHTSIGCQHGQHGHRCGHTSAVSATAVNATISTAAAIDAAAIDAITSAVIATDTSAVSATALSATIRTAAAIGAITARTPSRDGVPCRIAPSDCVLGQSAWPTAAY